MTHGIRHAVAGRDRVAPLAIVFCGSKKSLASGIPMANILFSPATTGLIVLPLMIFHQSQLMVCAGLGRRYARQATAAAQPLPHTPPTPPAGDLTAGTHLGMRSVAGKP